jgi:hypothetical protein
MGRSFLKSIVAISVILNVVPCFAAQPIKDARYYCVADFGGGLFYNDATHKWEGVGFGAHEHKFVLHVQFDKAGIWKPVDDLDEKVPVNYYKITVADPGIPVEEDCLGTNKYGSSPFVIDEFTGVLMCHSGLYDYRFQLGTNRFLSAYLWGFVDGKDKNEDNPSVDGGTCTKID